MTQNRASLHNRPTEFRGHPCLDSVSYTDITDTYHKRALNMHKPITYAEIDLDALQQNLCRARQFAGSRKLMAVIKADAYGHGMEDVARRLSNHCDGFAVARFEEVMALRKAIPNARILWLSGPSNSFECTQALNSNIDLVIHDFSQLALLKKPECRIGKHRLWLKMDTGMHRLGFLPNDFDRVFNAVHTSFPDSEITLISHFSSADEPESGITNKQVSIFSNHLPNKKLPLSLCNSAALMYHKTIADDWVRPGLMLYGVPPCPERQNALVPVMSFFSSVIAIKEIAAGECVGYGCRWTAAEKTRIAIVAAGYGDGYPVQAPDGTPVWVRGKRCPIVGRVSMDMLCVNCTDVDELSIGEQVELWGKNLPVSEIADYCKLIPYALLTGVTKRVKRIPVN
ncbi:MAG: alanine racemase [Pseudomonadales bacterium]|nr:alanine racemase [Pseudomonadales bacterium]